MTGSRKEKFLGSIDWLVVAIYIVMVFCGWLNIYAAVFDESHSSIFDLSQNYGKQLIWIGVSLFIAISILLFDAKYWHILAYPLYCLSILLLFSVLFLGSEVNGNQAWLVLGPVKIQPAEFVKITTALALGRYMSHYSFDIRKGKDLFQIAVIIGIPMVLVLMQNDTGSALVFGSFLIMLYREGFYGWVYGVLIMIITLFVLSFLVEPLALLIILIVVCVLAEGLTNGYWRQKVIYLAGLALITFAIYSFRLFTGWNVSLYTALLIALALSSVMVVLYAYRYKVRNILLFIGLFIGSLVFIHATDYIFDNILQPHHQSRILDLLGVESDLKGVGYNVNQSKIAIGSGGLTGKGFMQGTQTKFNFVPEQSTDFIFCTVGEEWGFLGASFVVILFAVLLFRLIRMGERQPEAFGRIYCYCAASVFFFHMVINIGMTIGLTPVIGIPLPFFSYGGSSMLAFTILLFIAVKLDASRNELKIS